MAKIFIRRENWKGKLLVVARDNKGRIRAVKKWNQKFTLKKARGIYKTNRTFNSDVEKLKKTNVVQVLDTSERPKIPTGEARQFYVSGKIEGIGKVIRRSDLATPQEASMKELKSQAFDRFYSSVAEARGQGYDEDEGIQLVRDENVKVKTGVVYYKRL